MTPAIGSYVMYEMMAGGGGASGQRLKPPSTLPQIQDRRGGRDVHLRFLCWLPR
jgi:hypothetical protein